MCNNTLSIKPKNIQIQIKNLIILHINLFYKFIKKIFVFLFVFFIITKVCSQVLTAREIVEKSNNLFLGRSSISNMTMTIKRPEWERSYNMQSWSLGNEYYIIYIISPAHEQGQVFMKNENNMWNWIPSINRIIKIPPSMMMQSWMGSDFTNDDIMRANSIVEDYTHKIIGEEIIKEYDCYKIELNPLPDAPVVWGKIISWISKSDFFQLRNEYYDDYLELVNVAISSEIEWMDNIKIPTLLTIFPIKEPHKKTELKINFQDFDIPFITKSYFSQQNMKKIRPRKK